MTIAKPIYLPDSPGVPAERFVVFTTPQHDTMLIDESEKKADGKVFTGTWESPTLSREDHARLFTLSLLTVHYEAETSTSFRVEASADGGENWTEGHNIPVDGTSGGVEQETVGFSTTGTDVRIRIRFDQSDLVKVVGYRARLIPRGPSYYG